MTEVERCATKKIYECHTYFDRESRGEPEDEEVVETGEVGAGTRHELDDGCHLLHQGEWVLLTHPQSALEPTAQHSTGSC